MSVAGEPGVDINSEINNNNLLRVGGLTIDSEGNQIKHGHFAIHCD